MRGPHTTWRDLLPPTVRVWWRGPVLVTDAKGERVPVHAFADFVKDGAHLGGATGRQRCAGIRAILQEGCEVPPPAADDGLGAEVRMGGGACAIGKG